MDPKPHGKEVVDDLQKRFRLDVIKHIGEAIGVAPDDLPKIADEAPQDGESVGPLGRSIASIVPREVRHEPTFAETVRAWATHWLTSQQIADEMTFGKTSALMTKLARAARDLGTGLSSLPPPAADELALAFVGPSRRMSEEDCERFLANVDHDPDDEGHRAKLRAKRIELPHQFNLRSQLVDRELHRDRRQLLVSGLERLAQEARELGDEYAHAATRTQAGDVELRQAVADLAHIYRQFTGRRPTVSYNAIKGERGGEFLGFARLATSPIWGDNKLTGIAQEVCDAMKERLGTVG